MSTQLTLRKLTKTYRTGGQPFVALSPINLAVKTEEFVCVVGPNGCGKSTLLKLIAGIEQPTSGTMTLAAKTAYLPQQPSLLPWRTIEENLFLPGDIEQTPRAQSKTAITRLLRDFGLAEFADYYPKALSGGMQQKVALLRTVLFSPSFLLLDEPFAALDAITRLELQRWLLDLKQKTRATIICVTHDIREAVFLADTIYVLSKRPAKVVKKFSVADGQTGKLENKLYELLVDKP